MPLQPSERTTCAYLQKNGVICGKSCYYTYCGVHATRISNHSICLNCGRSTVAASGYCSIDRCRRAGLCAAAAAKRSRGLSNMGTALDEFVDELLNSFNPATQTSLTKASDQRQVLRVG